MRGILLLFLFICVVIASPVVAAEKLKVVASFPIWADIIRQIGGDQVDVYSLVKPEGDVHAYEAKPQDIVKLQLADLIVINGLGLEPSLEKILQAQNLQSHTLIISKNIKTLSRQADFEDNHEGNTIADPHIWNDPKNVIIAVDTITKKLAELQPSFRQTFADHATHLKTELMQIDRNAAEAFAQFSHDQKRILTAHDALQYFGKAYDITLLPLQGMSTMDEPTPQHISNVMTQVKSGRVQAIFLEKGTNPKLMQALSRQVGITVNGNLYADTLSNDHGPANTYQEMFTYNLHQILNALKK